MAEAAHIPRAQQHPPHLPPDVVAETFSPPTGGTPASSASTSAESSQVTTPMHGTSGPGFVPAYPFNTSLAPFLSPSHGLGNATPDDSEVTTNLPSVQVDYLSHEWSEEDVWTSWRATTKHKASIANGLRLENASWRTWNKQRNNLKTISPETLNWLKDSDVTWLYGPLHTRAVESVPKTKASAAEDRLGLERGVSAKARGKQQATKENTSINRRSASPSARNSNHRLDMGPKKPILKYRSLSDILTVPTTKRQRHNSFDEHDTESGASTPTGSGPSLDGERPRAPSLTPPSDTASMRSFVDALRNPPEESSDGNTTEANHTSGDEKSGRRRHIVFNHRVEQCIAVDSAEDRERYNNNNRSRLGSAVPKWGARLHRPKPRTGGSFFQANESDSDDMSRSSDSSGEEEETLLTFRSSRSSSHSGHTVPFPTFSATEHYTIAKLAPTILKNSEILPSPSPAVVYDSGPSQSTFAESDTDDDATPVRSAATSQLVAAGGRRHTITPEPSTVPSHVGRSVWSDSDNDYSSVGLEYHNMNPADGDFVLSDAAYSVGDNPSSGSSLYADYDPVPRGHFAKTAHSPQLPTIELAETVPSPTGPAPTNKATPPTRSILKPRVRTSSDSSASSSGGQSPTPASPLSGTPVNSVAPIAEDAETDEEYSSRGRPIQRASSSSSLEARSRSSGGAPSNSPIVTIGSQVPRTARAKQPEDPTGSNSGSNSENEAAKSDEELPLRKLTDESDPGKAEGEDLRRSAHPTDRGAVSVEAAEADDRKLKRHSRSPSFDIDPKSRSARPLFSRGTSSDLDGDMPQKIGEFEQSPASAARNALLRNSATSTDEDMVDSSEGSPRSTTSVTAAKEVIGALYSFGTSLLWRPKEGET